MELRDAFVPFVEIGIISASSHCNIVFSNSFLGTRSCCVNVCVSMCIVSIIYQEIITRYTKKLCELFVEHRTYVIDFIIRNKHETHSNQNTVHIFEYSQKFRDTLLSSNSNTLFLFHNFKFSFISMFSIASFTVFSLI